MLTATVSGSFHRHLDDVMRVVAELGEMGVTVLSPADPRVVDNLGGFLLVASDRMRTVRLVQDRHLESIRSSDFLWLVAPDGYVGRSTAMEVGFAAAHHIPILCSTLPTDLTLRQYAKKVSTLREAIATVSARTSQSREQRARFLIDPHAGVQAAHETLSRIDEVVRRYERQGSSAHSPTDLYAECHRLEKHFSLPTA